jgi:hypothetical protein
MIGMFFLCAALNVGTVSEKLLDSIEMVESSGQGAKTPDGDNGRAIGPFQIWEPYYKDACRFQPSLSKEGTYQDCKNPVYARKVVKAYLEHYAPNKSDMVKAMIHNGGPSIEKKVGTKAYVRAFAYWKKVATFMKRKQKQ